MSHDSQPQFVNVENNLSSQLGRPAADVWVHFIKEPVRNSKGHFSAKCLYCPKKFQRGEATRLVAHLANHCIGCDPEIRKKYLELINQKNTRSNDISLSSEQSLLSRFYESTSLTKEREHSINRSLIKAFVCAGIPFSSIQNPYFVELLQQLRPAYHPPSSEVLSGRLLDNEVALVNQKLNNILERDNNLTLGNFIYV